MDPFKYTTIGHSGHRVCSPISDAHLDRIMVGLSLQESDRVIDVASGKCEMSIRLVERYGVSAVAIDHSPLFMVEAQAERDARGIAERLTLITDAARNYDPDGESFDLAICVGARPYGSQQKTLKALVNLVKPGGRIFIGEGYWKQQPDPAFLEFLDATVDDYGSHEQTMRQGVDLGLELQHESVSSLEELDDYDGRYAKALEVFVAEHPDDPDGPEILGRIQKWRRAYFRWFRETIGFGLYVYKRPVSGLTKVHSPKRMSG